MKTFIKYILPLILLANAISAQITSGKVVYERRTNLYKKFKGEDQDWIRDYIKESDKNKIDVFELYFNDSLSVFQPQESDLKEEHSWMTSKNTVYQNFNTNQLLNIKEIWGENLYVADTLRKRQWKITEIKRTIAGYSCRKAVWQANDSTRIYAWYSDELMASTGPETFNGLPGVILGLATEDGGVIYFAKSIEMMKPELTTLVAKKGKNKIYTSKELRTKLEKDYGKYPWGKTMISNVFGVW